MRAVAFFATENMSSYIKVEGETAEACLTNLSKEIAPVIGYHPTLTFRPADGAIFCNDWSDLMPLGVVFRHGYQDKEGQ